MSVNDAMPENTGLEGGQPPHEKRTNGHTVSVSNSDSPSDQVLDAGDSLGSPASVSETDADFDASDAPIDYASLDIPGADPSDDVQPFEVVSTPEHVTAAGAFFEAAKADESDAQRKRARTRSRVFSLMQYHRHPETGEPLFSQEQVEAGLAALGPSLHRWAYVWHRLDRLVEVDEGTGEPTCTGLKGDHWHAVLWTSEDRPTIRTVSDAFGIPSARVKTPREVAAQEGSEDHKGRNAAEKAFYDLAEYLTHESRRGTAIQGVHQTERYYLVDTTQPTHPGKYQYGRGRVVASFDFGRELDAHMAGRVSAADGGAAKSLRARKQKLRLAVMDGLTLAEAREADRAAYADDLPRLRELAKEFQQIQERERVAGLGEVWRKSFILAAGRTRAGKDLLLEALTAQLVWLASLAGLQWRTVKPAGRNALEGVAGADVVHHEDARYSVVPGYDEALRYFDPNQSTEVAARFTNRAAPAPRAILASTSETLGSFAYTLKRRASSEYLAELAADTRTAPRYPLDVDEFLLRIGWYVEVTKPEGTLDDVDAIRDAMVCAIYRVRDGDETRTQSVTTRTGDHLGDITTRHQLEPVAVIKGCDATARFLAVSIVQERNPDVAEAIPAETLAPVLAERQQIEASARREEESRSRAREIARLQTEIEVSRRVAAERERLEQEAALKAALRARCTCPSKPYYDRDHELDCPVLPESIRTSRVETARLERERKIALVKANGLDLSALSRTR